MDGFALAAPWWLALAVAGGAAAALVVWATGARAHAAQQFGRGYVRGRSWAMGFVIALTLAGMALAAARPQWGTSATTLPRRGVDVVYVVDVSHSMGATDVSPTRMAAAREAIIASFGSLRDVRVGLVIFAGTARVRFPLTTDLRAAASIVRMLEPGQVVVGPGTSVAAGLEAAQSLFASDSGAGRLVVLVTDGDDLGPPPRDQLEALRAREVALLVVGVGTPTGSPVPVVDRQRGEWTVLRRPNGSPVVTRLDERFLAEVATIGGGQYLGAELDRLPAAVRARVASLAAADVETRTVRVPIERFHLFVWGALALLLGAWVVGGVQRRWPGAALALAVVPLLVIGAACTSEARRLNEAGRDAFAAGEYDLAAERFREALAAEPANDRLALNLAAALHAAGRYDEAALAARRAANSPDEETRALAHRFLGHHAFAQGRLEEALAELRRSLIVRPTEDARHDYEVVYALLRGRREPSTSPPSPTAEATAAPPPTPTVAPETEPSPSTPGSGGENAQPGAGSTPQPGGGADQGGERPPTDAQIGDRIAAIDREIAAILEETGGQLSDDDVLRILDLLAERERLSALRGIRPGTADPNDY